MTIRRTFYVSCEISSVNSRLESVLTFEEPFFCRVAFPLEAPLASAWVPSWLEFGIGLGRTVRSENSARSERRLGGESIEGKETTLSALSFGALGCTIDTLHRIDRSVLVAAWLAGCSHFEEGGGWIRAQGSGLGGIILQLCVGARLRQE